MEELARLLTNSSSAISESVGRDRLISDLSRWGECGRDLGELLATRNGFFAYGRALLVRSLSSTNEPLGLKQWNQGSLWRDEYDLEFGLGDALFFAEDAFGEQFCLHDNAIYRFEPESGVLSRVSDRLQGWLRLVTREPEVVTAYSILHNWEAKNGDLPPGHRLVPILPFVLGGEYDLSNLHAIPDSEGMSFRANIANQIRALPDGAKVVLRDPKD